MPVLHNCCCRPGQLSILSHGIRIARRASVPSVESIIVPSKSESTPSKVTTSAGAEKDPAAVEVIVGEGLGICSNIRKCAKRGVY